MDALNHYNCGNTTGVHHSNQANSTAPTDENGIETYQASPTHEYTDSMGNTYKTNKYIQPKEEDGIIYDYTHEEKVTDDIKIVTEINATNLGNNTQADNPLEHDEPIAHGYNLRPRPVKPRERYNPLQITQQSTYGGCTNTHLHVLMAQMSLKAGIKIR